MTVPFDGPAVAPALEVVLALTPYEWAAVVFGVGLCVYVLAMLYAFLRVDSRPTLNQRCAAEVEEARR